MHEESIIGIAITLLSGLFSIVILSILLRKQTSKPLKLLFMSTLFLNFVWYSTLVFYLLRSVFPMPGDPLNIYWLEFFLFSLLYVLRFGLMISLLLLFRHILGDTVSDKAESIVIKSVSFLLLFWFIGWIEVPLLGSKSITNQLMVLTDFLIFVSVIIAAVYLQYRTSFLFDKEYKRGVNVLCMIIIIPFAVGSIKLVISTSLMKISSMLERSMIYGFISFYNISTALWAIKYSSLIEKSKNFGVDPGKTNYSQFVESYKISKRESEVIQLICEGKSNKEIAAQLFISIDTVKDHNYKIYQKAGVKRRIQLVNLVNGFLNKQDNYK
ncbi:response regulator transcription factor [Bacteroidota bacterium]